MAHAHAHVHGAHCAEHLPFEHRLVLRSLQQGEAFAHYSGAITRCQHVLRRQRSGPSASKSASRGGTRCSANIEAHAIPR